MTLRSYQTEAVQASLHYLGNGDDRGLLVAPTGSGKSHIIAEIVRNLDGDAVVFQPSREILARPTRSLALYYQQVGRAIRPHAAKKWAAVVDLVGLVRTFGKVEDLELRPGGVSGQKWAVWSGRRQLTNVYLDGFDQRGAPA